MYSINTLFCSFSKFGRRLGLAFGFVSEVASCDGRVVATLRDRLDGRVATAIVLTIMEPEVSLL